MATTTNFGWETPDDTDLVKDGAAAMRTLGNSIDTSFVDLKGGTTGQILSKASNTDLDYTWIAANPGDITEVAAGTGISGGGTSGAVTITNSMATAIDAKGDLVAGTGADTFSRLAVGTNGQVLTADSTAATGLKWASSGTTASGVSLYRSTDLNVSTGTATQVTWNNEYFDTDGYHDTSTNTSRVTIPSGKAGKYLVTSWLYWQGTSGGVRETRLYRNGSQLLTSQPKVSYKSASADQFFQLYSNVVDLAVSDYLEIYAYQDQGTTQQVYGTQSASVFSVMYLGA